MPNQREVRKCGTQTVRRSISREQVANCRMGNRQFAGSGCIESLETSRIKTSREDYTKVIIPDNSVIYCDPPYKGAKGYCKSEFDQEAFYEWCTRQKVPVYISEYYMPEELFEVVAKKPKRNTQSATKNLLRIEKIYKPRKIEVK